MPVAPTSHARMNVYAWLAGGIGPRIVVWPALAAMAVLTVSLTSCGYGDAAGGSTIPLGPVDVIDAGFDPDPTPGELPPPGHWVDPDPGFTPTEPDPDPIVGFSDTELRSFTERYDISRDEAQRRLCSAEAPRSKPR